MKTNHGIKSSLLWVLILGSITLFLYQFFIADKNPTPMNMSDNVLRVGTNVGYAPFVFTDNQGNVIGFDVDLINVLANKMGKKAVIEHMAFDALIVALKQNKVDLIIGGVAITPSRCKEIDLIPYYGEGETTLSMLFWDKVPSGVATLADLKTVYPDEKPTVCTQAGTVFEPYLQKWTHILHPKTLDDTDDIVLDIRYSKSVAAVLETVTAKKLQQLHPSIKVVTFPVDKEDQTLGSGIGVQKENAELKAALEKGVDEMRKSGEIKALADKWFVKE